MMMNNSKEILGIFLLASSWLGGSWAQTIPVDDKNGDVTGSLIIPLVSSPILPPSSRPIPVDVKDVDNPLIITFVSSPPIPPASSPPIPVDVKDVDDPLILPPVGSPTIPPASSRPIPDDDDKDVDDPLIPPAVVIVGLPLEIAVQLNVDFPPGKYTSCSKEGQQFVQDFVNQAIEDAININGNFTLSNTNSIHDFISPTKEEILLLAPLKMSPKDDLSNARSLSALTTKIRRGHRNLRACFPCRRFVWYTSGSCRLCNTDDLDGGAPVAPPTLSPVQACIVPESDSCVFVPTLAPTRQSVNSEGICRDGYLYQQYNANASARVTREVVRDLNQFANRFAGLLIDLDVPSSCIGTGTGNDTIGFFAEVFGDRILSPSKCPLGPPPTTSSPIVAAPEPSIIPSIIPTKSAVPSLAPSINLTEFAVQIYVDFPPDTYLTCSNEGQSYIQDFVNRAIDNAVNFAVLNDFLNSTRNFIPGLDEALLLLPVGQEESDAGRRFVLESSSSFSSEINEQDKDHRNLQCCRFVWYTSGSCRLCNPDDSDGPPPSFPPTGFPTPYPTPPPSLCPEDEPCTMAPVLTPPPTPSPTPLTTREAINSGGICRDGYLYQRYYAIASARVSSGVMQELNRLARTVTMLLNETSSCIGTGTGNDTISFFVEVFGDRILSPTNCPLVPPSLPPSPIIALPEPSTIPSIIPTMSALPSVYPSSEPSYFTTPQVSVVVWERYRVTYGQRVKLCKDISSVIVPKDNSSCKRKRIGEYTCFWGEQTCKDGTAHPLVKCDCLLDGKWSCANPYQPCSESNTANDRKPVTTCPAQHPLNFPYKLTCKSDFLVCNYGVQECCGEKFPTSTCECIDGEFKCFNHSTCIYRQCSETCPAAEPKVGETCDQKSPRETCAYDSKKCCDQNFMSRVHHCYQGKWDIVTDLLWDCKMCPTSM